MALKGLRSRAGAALVLLATLWCAPDAYAERYALLVGVSKYAASEATGHSIDLEGPAQDIAALQRLLIDRQGFRPESIVVLVDQAATRRAILDRLAERVAAMRDGDYLLFYFSGHGTSAFDAKMQPVSAFIGPNSGALVPYDFQTDSPEHAGESLIVGRRDLQPILARLPQRSQAVVVLDACYSENSVRSIRQRLVGKTRGITLGTMVAGGGRSNAPQALDRAEIAPAGAEAERAYPYSNVVALTAASKDEQAIDIDSRMAVDGQYPTVDGRAHGAFTNSLLEGLSGGGDANHDGTITLQELYEFSRRRVQSRFAHTPQMLAPASVALGATPALGSALPSVVAPCRPTATTRDSTPVRVRLESVPEDLSRRLRSMEDVQVVTGGADLVVVRGPEQLFDLYDGSGLLIRQFRPAEAEDLVARIRAARAVEQFVALGVACPAFNVSLRLHPAGQSRFSARDRMQVGASLDRDAFIVLFNVDKAGTVSVVYPATAAERRRLGAGEVALANVRAVAPFGSEYLKVVAFADEPPLDRLGCRAAANGSVRCADVEPGSPAYGGLLRLLDGVTAAESHIRFTTYED